MYTNRHVGAVRFVRYHLVKKTARMRALNEINPALKNMSSEKIKMYYVVIILEDSHSLKRNKLIYILKKGPQENEVEARFLIEYDSGNG